MICSEHRLDDETTNVDIMDNIQHHLLQKTVINISHFKSRMGNLFTITGCIKFGKSLAGRKM